MATRQEAEGNRPPQQGIIKRTVRAICEQYPYTFPIIAAAVAVGATIDSARTLVDISDAANRAFPPVADPKDIDQANNTITAFKRTIGNEAEHIILAGGTTILIHQDLLDGLRQSYGLIQADQQRSEAVSTYQRTLEDSAPPVINGKSRLDLDLLIAQVSGITATISPFILLPLRGLNRARRANREAAASTLKTQ